MEPFFFHMQQVFNRIVRNLFTIWFPTELVDLKRIRIVNTVATIFKFPFVAIEISSLMLVASLWQANHLREVKKMLYFFERGNRVNTRN
jgi:hypothetical protein